MKKYVFFLLCICCNSSLLAGRLDRNKIEYAIVQGQLKKTSHLLALAAKKMGLFGPYHLLLRGLSLGQLLLGELS